MFLQLSLICIVLDHIHDFQPWQAAPQEAADISCGPGFGRGLRCVIQLVLELHIEHIDAGLGRRMVTCELQMCVYELSCLVGSVCAQEYGVRAASWAAALRKSAGSADFPCRRQ